MFNFDLYPLSERSLVSFLCDFNIFSLCIDVIFQLRFHFMPNKIWQNLFILVFLLAGKLACQIPKYLVLGFIYINYDCKDVYSCQWKFLVWWVEILLSPCICIFSYIFLFFYMWPFVFMIYLGRYLLILFFVKPIHVGKWLLLMAFTHVEIYGLKNIADNIG